MARWYVNYSGTGGGLRGGTWGWQQPAETASFTLKNVRWTIDLAVSGSMMWNQITGAVQANLKFKTDDGTSGTVSANWNDRKSGVPANLSGVVAGKILAASMPAP